MEFSDNTRKAGDKRVSYLNTHYKAAVLSILLYEHVGSVQ